MKKWTRYQISRSSCVCVLERESFVCLMLYEVALLSHEGKILGRVLYRGKPWEIPLPTGQPLSTSCVSKQGLSGPYVQNQPQSVHFQSTVAAGLERL